MAIILDVEEEEDGQLPIIKRKRKRKSQTQRKLLVGEIVEIRSKEEGFDGSWHPATVIDFGDLRRQVRYMHLLVVDDSDDRLIEWINVSCMIDGVIPNNGVIPANYRGVIRPVPPFCSINPWSLGYGLCVDAFVKEAWWEGVIFDHEDGENERSVFFPDLGDTQMVKIENLRITYDWNEVREDWTIRGDWLFLELVEKHEEELGWFSPVSVRQLWYNLRSKKAFKSGIKEWTCWDAASTWDGLVLEVIHDNINLYAELYLPVIESEVATNVIGCPNEVASTSTAVKFASPVNFIEHPCKRARSRTDDVINSECAVNVMEGPCKRTRSRSTSKSEATLPWRGILHDHVEQNHPALIQPEAPEENYLKRKSDSREVVDTSIDSDPLLLSQISSTTEDRDNLTDENFPDATASYLPGAEKKERAKLRSQIVSQGWNIIRYRDQYALRSKYMSPEGKPFYSLIQVRKYLNETKGNTRTQCFPHVRKGSGQASVKSLDSNGQTDTSSKNLQKHSGSEEEAGALDVMSPGFDPLALETREVEGANAVLDYYGLGPNVRAKDKNGLRVRAKKHLLDKGWKIWYGKLVTVYTSPNGKNYNSLRTACRGFFSDGLFRQRQRFMGKDSKEDLLLENGKPEKNCTSTSGWSRPREFKSSKIQLKNFRGPRRRRKGNLLSLASTLLQRRAYPTQKGMDRVLIRKGVNLDSTSPSRVPRSNKRARQVVPSNPEHFTPRTILSWLIDNNVVLPRAKVQYRNRKNQPVMAEGKITRDGIKCNCCQKVFAITNFVTHAGGNCHKSAANIFLEDGRSLLDCQKQVQDALFGLSSEPYQRIKSNFLPVKNDCICSVCHYGGILVLCDQCPSAFHQSCIGLEKLPQGKWFCPSCRCEICGKSDTNGNIGEFTEKTIIYCDQCEREFHVGCLREMRMMKLESCPKEKWCCSTTCEKIYTGLHNLLGRSTAVGVDNLSWTILKSVKDGYGRDAYDTEIMTEHQSKLNVALSVLHECFEPIKEPQTNDLVKDVVFNKRSTLKRLNFQGFYTVLLEKEDELISVATVRVYGGKVAEVPLVGTRVQYRRQGMCRILMNLLEKKLEEFGVQRLLLPAIPQVLQAWTTAFGFSKMTESERLKYLEYTFLDFQGTTMCQKILKMVPTLKIIGPREIQHELEDELNDTNGDAAVDKCNIVSTEAKPIQQSDILKQISFKVTSHDENFTLEMVSPDVVSKQELWIVAESADTQKENKDLESKCSKYYSRRKTIARYSCDPISLPVAIQQTSLNVSDMRV